MKITLTQLRFQNFKGAKDQTIDFTGRTSIYGQNASGKTRIFDAFAFLLFGKDSNDRKDFNIKCLDSNNEPLHKVETSVSGTLYIDSRKLTLQRVYKEKWQKKRGEETAEFNGHETLYFVNDVPHSQKDYQDKVNDILPESIFKQVTNPLYFNSMKWNERREMLSKMAGDITDGDVLKENPELLAFFEMIDGRAFEEYKKELAAKKKMLKEAIQNIPARIDEVSRAIQPDPDYGQIEKAVETHNAKITEIETVIASETQMFDMANKEHVRKQNRIYELEAKVKDLRFAALSKVEEQTHELKVKKIRLSNDANQLSSDIASKRDRITNLTARWTALEAENKKLRERWHELNQKTLTFDESQFACPACKRAFEAEDIEAKKAEMTANFNADKTKQLEQVTSEGKNNAAEIKKISDEITMLNELIAQFQIQADLKRKESDAIVIAEIPDINFNENAQIKVLQDEIEITRGLMKTAPVINNTELLDSKKQIRVKIDELKRQLTIKEQNEKLKVRKQELIDSERSLNQQIADLEKQEFQCEAFTKAKIDMIEQRVNSMFSIVRFKMFNTLINGGTEETCEALINGVPYSDANSAARIQAGLDIIKTLSRHYDVYAPVFIDNRESTTNIPDMECQVISLYVDPAKKELEVINN